MTSHGDLITAIRNLEVDVVKALLDEGEGDARSAPAGRSQCRTRMPVGCTRAFSFMPCHPRCTQAPPHANFAGLP